MATGDIWGVVHISTNTPGKSRLADVQLGHKPCGVLLGDAAARLEKEEEGWAEGRTLSSCDAWPMERVELRFKTRQLVPNMAYKKKIVCKCEAAQKTRVYCIPKRLRERRAALLRQDPCECGSACLRPSRPEMEYPPHT